MIPLSWVYVHLGRNFRELVDDAVALIEDGPSSPELLDALETAVRGQERSEVIRRGESRAPSERSRSLRSSLRSGRRRLSGTAGWRGST